ADARRHASQGALAEGVQQIRSALKVWRGPALAGIGSAMLARRAALLDEQRLSALEAGIDWQSELGEHREGVDEVTEIVAEHPLRERPYAQLMLALHHSGRQADALATFHRLRTSLAEELGVAPGLEVRKVHERILRGDPRTDEKRAPEPTIERSV